MRQNQQPRIVGRAQGELEKDPGESRNLIDDPRPEVKEARHRLEARIHENMRANRDPLLLRVR
jgi:hypothetical protein